MVTVDWTAIGLTALGGALAAGGGWLNGSAQARRERVRDDRSNRRAAYSEYLYQTQAFLETIVTIGRELRLAEHGTGEIAGLASMRERLDRAYVALRRAEQLLALSAPLSIRRAANDRSAKLHDLLHGIDSIISEPAKEDIEAKLSEIRPLLEVLDSEDDAASLPDLMARDLRR